jgi:hypothetical protein
MRNKKPFHKESWIVRYENGFITKTVDYLPTITDENQIVSKKQYRYQVWVDGALFFDSFKDKDDNGQLYINEFESDFNLDPDSNENQNYAPYQHEIGIGWLLESMDREFYRSQLQYDGGVTVNLGDKTYDIDGFPAGENEPI